MISKTSSFRAHRRAGAISQDLRMLVLVSAHGGRGPVCRSRDRAGARLYPDPDFRKLDSWIVHSRRQHGDLLCRQDGLRPGNGHGVPFR